MLVASSGRNVNNFSCIIVQQDVSLSNKTNKYEEEIDKKRNTKED